MTRAGNAKLAAVIAESGMSHAQVARAFVRVAIESDAQVFAGVGRSHVSHWIRGSKPSGRAPLILAEALSRSLGRAVTAFEIGLSGHTGASDSPGWRTDTLVELADLGSADVDAERRRVLSTAAYSVAALALPSGAWWREMAERGRSRGIGSSRGIGKGDVDAVREMVALFSKVDQKRGGGHGRSAVVQYLTSDVASFLRGRFENDETRKEMFSAASELAYLSGWMSFDDAEHTIAQRYFKLAVRLAAEAEDAAMAGHVLRAMAHQAIDLGHHKHAFDLAEASVAGERYADASPREKALLGVVHARSMAVNGDPSGSAKALLRAEDDLRSADDADAEPGRVFFFGEASLAHETACALRDTRDLDGAIGQFRRSVRTRKSATFTRTHAVTLGYLGDVQASKGELEEACTTWSEALDAMEGVRSGRARQVAANMRAVLSPFRQRKIRAAIEIDARASKYLAAFS